MGDLKSNNGGCAVAVSDQIDLERGDARLYERGLTVAHSSDGEGLPDVGQSVGLGDGRMLYVGERPGRPGWCICIYGQSEAIDIAEGLPAWPSDTATDLITVVAAAINK
ncbi:MAG: hypothetical protein AAFR79_12645 [Pseudomonadota bacterium]